MTQEEWLTAFNAGRDFERAITPERFVEEVKGVYTLETDRAGIIELLYDATVYVRFRRDQATWLRRTDESVRCRSILCAIHAVLSMLVPLWRVSDPRARDSRGHRYHLKS